MNQEGYRQTVERLDKLVREHVACGEAPRFALPPREIAVIAGLDQLGHRLARNDSAHALIDAICLRFTTREIPTVLMLGAVLEVRGIDVEHVALDALGLVLEDYVVVQSRQAVMPSREATMLPLARCPHCAYEVDCATGVGNAYRPTPGAISVCIKCAGVAQYGPELQLAAFDLETLDADTAAVVARVRRTILASRP